MKVQGPTDDGDASSTDLHWTPKEICESACKELAWLQAEWNQVALDGAQCCDNLATRKNSYLMDYDLTMEDELNDSPGVAVVNMS